jgi:hypothetical protein
MEDEEACWAYGIAAWKPRDMRGWAASGASARTNPAAMLPRPEGSREFVRIEAGIDDYMAIGKLLDGGLAAQVKLDLQSLERASGRTFTSEERKEIVDAQTKAYRWTFLLSGMTHPKFDKSLRELSPQGHARVAALVSAIS